MNKEKALLLFSGGFDSVVLLHWLLDENYDVTLLHFDYGQNSNVSEYKSTMNWAVMKEVKMCTINLPEFKWSKSDALKRNQDEKSGKDYIESRNLILLAYGMSYAEANGIDQVFTGFIGPEHYPDTSPTFLKLVNAIAETSCQIDINAPFVHMGKDDLFNMAVQRGWNVKQILDKTISCNMSDPVTGEICGSCKDCKAREGYYNQLKEAGHDQ